MNAANVIELVYDYYDGRDRDNVVEHQRRVQNQIQLRYNLRITTDPFAVSITEFMRLYRMPQHLVFELSEIVRPYVPASWGSKYVPLPIKVLATIGMFASGSYQRHTGRMSDINVSQSMMCRSIAEVTDALNHPNILRRFIRFPSTPAERRATIAINERLGMVSVLGFVDGTLVRIVPPNGPHKQVYRCRKGFPAINVQIVCNANLEIINVNAQFTGSSNDPFIYRASGVRDAAMEAYNAGPCWFLGDSIYPHEPWMMIPIPDAVPGTPEMSYTRLHCHCRNCVERCIGLLKARWRCLLADRTLHYQPRKAGLIINGCVVLHNFLINRHAPMPAPIREDLGRGEAEPVLEEDAELFETANEVRRYLIDHAHRRYLRYHQND